MTSEKKTCCVYHGTVRLGPGRENRGLLAPVQACARLPQSHGARQMVAWESHGRPAAGRLGSLATA